MKNARSAMPRAASWLEVDSRDDLGTPSSHGPSSLSAHYHDDACKCARSVVRSPEFTASLRVVAR